MMVAIQIEAYIDENGELRAHVPEDFPRGKVKMEVRVQTPTPPPVILTPEEEAELDREIEKSLANMRAGGQGKTGAEIAAWLEEHGGPWEDYGITDSVEWLAELRRKEWERKFGDQTW